MIRSTVIALAVAFLASPVLAEEFVPSAGGYIEFTMPSNNIGCVYRDEEGSGLVLECDRVAPSYLRVRLFQDGKPQIYRNVGDPSCCGAENYLEYGASWREGPFSCSSTKSGLRCNNGDHGFTLNRSGVKSY
jgi:hypothetical protein